MCLVHVFLETTLNFVVRGLHSVVKKGKEDSWKYLISKDVSRTSVDAFISTYDLQSTVKTSQTSTTTTAVIDDLSPFCRYETYDTKHNGTVWCSTDSNYGAVVGPAHLELVQTYQTKKSPEKTKLTLTVNVLRWDGESFCLDSSFTGSGKMKSKARRFTKLLIWHGDKAEEDLESDDDDDDDDAQLSAEGVKENDAQPSAEGVRETFWRLHSKLFSLSNLSAIRAADSPQLDRDAMAAYLDQLQKEVGKLKTAILQVAGCHCFVPGPCSCDDERKELCLSLLGLHRSCVTEVKLCTDHLELRFRVSQYHGFTFHPNTKCACCTYGPIVGWRYHCETCNVSLCQKDRCIASHNIDHILTLIRTPPAIVDNTPEAAAAEEQKWAVSSIMDRWPLTKKRGDPGPRQYLYHVQWAGIGMKPTWERAEDLNNPEMIALYNAKFTKSKNSLRDASRY